MSKDRCPADESDANSPPELSRRAVLRVAASAAAVAPFAELESALAQNADRRRAPGKAQRTRSSFFNVLELKMLDELTEMIIPADDHSPGARAAGVAAAIDRRLAELNARIAEHARERQTWRDGLKLVNDLSRTMHRQSFMQVMPAQRDFVMQRMAAQEARHAEASAATEIAERPASPNDIYRQQSRKDSPPTEEIAASAKNEGEFFAFLKEQTARFYYRSKIGLLQELNYQGNRYLEEFAGYDVDGTYTKAKPK